MRYLVAMRLSLFLLTAATVFGQETLRFEVASVKPLETDVLSTIPTRSAGRFTWGTDLGYLIGYAYRLQPDRIAGSIPGSKHIYQVTATTRPDATDDELRLMVRSLLADRFQMKSHIETKEADRYVLSVARGGMKTTKPDEDDELPPAEGRVVSLVKAAGVVKVAGTKASISALCETLERSLGTPVIDETGLSGAYSFAFRYASGVGPSDESPIFGALQRELGLRLEKKKGPVAILVVDSVSVVPTEN
jgi:uncharacterized protein (TIGR03435 family)